MTLLTDYGYRDAFAGVCHGVIAGICPQARIIDLTHGIPAGNVRAGALALAGAIGFIPRGVHVGIVDPGVGSARRAIAAASADGRRFVGPDNGLLWPALDACGGAVEVVEISTSPFTLQPVSATFHGRDIFAPVAAHLAAGVSLAAAGEPIAAAGLVALSLPGPEVAPGRVSARVAGVDAFGNVQLTARGADLEAAGIRLGQRVELSFIDGAAARAAATARYARTFAEVPKGELVIYEDSTGAVALAVNRGSAEARLGVGEDDIVRIARAVRVDEEATT